MNLSPLTVMLHYPVFVSLLRKQFAVSVFGRRIPIEVVCVQALVDGHQRQIDRHHLFVRQFVPLQREIAVARDGRHIVIGLVRGGGLLPGGLEVRRGLMEDLAGVGGFFATASPNSAKRQGTGNRKNKFNHRWTQMDTDV